MEHYKKLLLNKEKEVLASIKSIDDNTFSMDQKELTGEMSSYDQHSADLALSTFERGKDLGLKDGLKIQLEKTRTALKRLEKGSYGHCLSCGVTLPRERLDAVPDAELCVKCQERQEVVPVNKRPVEERLPYEHVMTGVEEMADDVTGWQEEGP